MNAGSVLSQRFRRGIRCGDSALCRRPADSSGTGVSEAQPTVPARQRFPIPKGSPLEINALAHEVVAEILSDAASVKTERGAVYDITAPDRRGLRFHVIGALKGFLEP